MLEIGGPLAVDDIQVQGVVVTIFYSQKHTSERTGFSVYGIGPREGDTTEK